MSRRTSWSYYKAKELHDGTHQEPVCLRYSHRLKPFYTGWRAYWQRKPYQSWAKHLYRKNGICRRCGHNRTEERKEIG